MSSNLTVVDLAEASAVDRALIGGKAAVLADLTAARFSVPPGIVVTTGVLDDPQLDRRLAASVEGLGGERFAVRSSGAAEDLPDASYAGLYETYLNVPADGLGAAVRRCFAAAASERVTAYHQRRGGATAAMAVLVQVMVDPIVAGVAFTAHPVTGDRDQTLVAAVAGLGDPLVSGVTTGEEWTVTASRTAMTRSGPGGGRVLTDVQADAVAELSRRIADRYDGRPQDVEWAIDRAGRLWLLQARPMTAVPEPVSWTAPGPGLWMRNFRLGEWLPRPSLRCSPAGCCRCSKTGISMGCTAASGCECRSGTRWSTAGTTTPHQSRHQNSSLGCCGRDAGGPRRSSSTR